MVEDSNSIQAKKLRVAKGKTIILPELDFTMPRGVIIGLIGPSGSGKTTLMRTIVGVQKYTGGLQVLGKAAGNKKLRSRIGYVTQSPAIYQDLTVLQNLRYFATLIRASKLQVNTAINQVDLAGHKNQLAATLSGGQKARVSLAIALLGNPELLVLDEPTVGLDPILRRDLWNLFDRLADEGKTLLISSHVMDEADRCSELYLLRDGQLLWQDTRELLLEKTKTRSVEDAFLSIVTRENN
jgi:ABC-2 type transport system ATP-binding protein